jgi:ATP-dependent DNA helicase DinG
MITPPVVAIALRTSGSDPGCSCVTELAAVVATDDGGMRTLFHRRDGALTADLVAVAPEGAAWIAHDGTRVGGFLKRLIGTDATPVILDTAAYARVCYPHLLDYELSALCRALAVDEDPADSLTAACANTLRLWRRLVERATKLPHPVTRELSRLLDGRHAHAWRALAGAGTTTARRGSRAPLMDLYASESLPPRRQPALEGVHTPLNPADVTAVFRPDGPLAAALAGYESRPQQSEMAAGIAGAFNDDQLLMVEAGTGVGKSLAYLVPAAMWAALNDTPVVISTSTKNLQSQLIEKDIPLLARVLARDFKAVVIKGRRNYLCLRKFLFLLHHGAADLDPRERALLSEILVWSTTTESGDISECAACTGSHRNLNEEITSAGGECQGPQCAQRKQCFLYRARREALAADVVIANHAVVLSELDAGGGSVVLPPHRQIVLDEAHNIEDAATSAFSVEVSMRHLRYLVNRLWRSGGRRGGGHGLAALLSRRLDSGQGTCTAEARTRAGRLLSKAITDQQSLWAAANMFFAALAAVLPTRTGRESMRLNPERHDDPGWPAVDDARRALIAAVAGIVHALDAVLEILAEAGPDALGDDGDFTQLLHHITEELRQFTNDVDFVLEAEADDTVFWIERLPDRLGGAAAWAAPIRVGPRLHELLYTRKDSVVLTSATLSVAGSLTYLRRRLGTDRIPPERVRDLILGSPFEYGRQCTALTPTFLPDPDTGNGDYVQALGGLLADVFRRSRGRGMALFTSYQMLTQTAAVLREALAGSGMRVLVQGESGSREAILDAFREDGAAVLLGTHSFWEGVDVIGDALSCLVVARLPFAVFTDPVIEARCQQVEADGDSAFMGFSVPNAVIKLRQGFGRLIRSHTDRGLVIIADRRIVSRRYGHRFRSSLPVPVRAIPDPDEFRAVVQGFFESVND